MRAAAHMLAVYFGLIGRTLMDQRTVARPAKRLQLSRRQVECLRWVRDGKSSADIGDILSLSAPTVDDYITPACKRLDVRIRTQAVARALVYGLL